MRIADIGFEDYYLIHDLLCHKTHTQNPEQYTIRESLKMAYFHSIYNHGKLNLLHKEYSLGLVDYLKSFDNIFTTNYDSNLESATGKEIYHIHGQFDKLSETYNPTSFRNHLMITHLKGYLTNQNINIYTLQLCQLIVVITKDTRLNKIYWLMKP